MARRSLRSPTPEDSQSPSPSRTARRSPSRGVDARARGDEDADADSDEKQEIWHQQQQRAGGRCMAGTLADRSVQCLVEPAAGSSRDDWDMGSNQGHFTIGSVNKGDKKDERQLRDKDILSSPCIVLFLQDTAPFDDNVFFARVCGVGGAAMVVMLMFLHDGAW